MGASLRRSPASAALAGATAAAALLVGLLSGYEPELGLLLAVGLAFAALVFADLFAGFAVMVLFAYLEVYSVLGSVSLAKLVGALLFVSWLAALTARGRRRRNFLAERPGLTYLLLLFVAWTAISVAWAESRPDALTSVSRYALNIVLLPIAYAAIDDRRDAVRILAVLVGAACIAAVSGIISRPSASAVDYARATGTVGDPNELAAALVVALFVAAAFAANRSVAGPLRVAAGFAALLCFTGVLTTLSRGGLVGIAAAVGCAVLVAGRWRRRILAACTALLVLGAAYFGLFASLPAKERVLNVGGGGTGRLDLWTVAGRMIDAHPIIGIGTGQFRISSVHYLLRPGAFDRGDYILVAPKVAHNTYLNITAELGIVGGLLFLAIVVACAGCAWRAIGRFRDARDERMEILARGLFAGLGGYLVTLVFISEGYSKLMWILFALGPAFLAVARGRPAEPPG